MAARPAQERQRAASALPQRNAADGYLPYGERPICLATSGTYRASPLTATDSRSRRNTRGTTLATEAVVELLQALNARARASWGLTASQIALRKIADAYECRGLRMLGVSDGEVHRDRDSRMTPSRYHPFCTQYARARTCVMGFYQRAIERHNMTLQESLPRRSGVSRYGKPAIASSETLSAKFA